MPIGLASLIPAGISLLGSIFGGGSHPSTSATSTATQPQEGLTYTPPPIDIHAPQWQGAAGQWEAIGIALIVILLLGAFQPTRYLAIAIAFLLGAILILGKVNG